MRCATTALLRSGPVCDGGNAPELAEVHIDSAAIGGHGHRVACDLTIRRPLVGAGVCMESARTKCIRWQRPLAAGLLRASVVAMLCFAVACHDVAGPSRGASVSPLASTAAMNVTLDTAEDQWNYYSADVTVTQAAVSRGPHGPLGAKSISFTVTRTLPDSVWKTTYDFHARRPDGFGSSVPAYADVAQIETDDANSIFKVHMRDGRLFPVASPAGALIAPPAGSAPAVLSWSGWHLASQYHGAASPRAWIANLLITPRNRTAVIAARQRNGGAPAGVAHGLSRYVHTSRRGETVEELVDSTSGATIERNITAHGQLVMHMTRSFVDVGGGRSLLAAVRIQTAASDPTQPPHQIDIVYNNVRFERRILP